MAKADTEEQLSESYISVGLGLLVVVVVGILLYNYFTQKGNKSAEEKTSEAEKIAQEATVSAKPGSTYTVQKGDTLWSISENSFKSGYNWSDIAKANNLTSPDQIEEGQKLVIPEASPISPTATETPAGSPVAATATTGTPSESSYTVVIGDSLWNIACKTYNDCYAWTKIAQANKLVNPNLIHPGNVFSLPR
ncbi:MAG: 5'-Nucleotidase domain-containing protein [Candidatus Gottesmanbacteria bacterium GW2011_GWB1_43_11]|uniref:5'-Nucleotidase domain-containing protein n=1 Tax=Candidatus Gottesmanbacteria bacterium GW2011_GWB1_43_11 TaxID=1618446 RepID=A0A0G1CLL6_9BACT|nr:MAG: 5'-Nucleotidase domain-containing protein [Candidatus Gottesmanbacteria bacterium GW2011_GWA2_42_16]KKS82038.1 MAG: hypothetical protein UV55_C0006G0045 [Candidatus Gottesmanbacteria bacterium GW2011_GWC1_43_10]KKS86399.1 MAG: 5'-Nucleotidase domain-containing protein [Candidatus Gottesmanbacteria bacterium GW2011_GWB1_43_11]